MRVCAIFKVPIHYGIPDEALAYVEHFTTPRKMILNQHVLTYQVTRANVGAHRNQKYKASIVPLSSIHSSCHLIPKFGEKVQTDWTSDNVLDKCNKFFVNDLLSLHMYQFL